MVNAVFRKNLKILPKPKTAKLVTSLVQVLVTSPSSDQQMLVKVIWKVVISYFLVSYLGYFNYHLTLS